MVDWKSLKIPTLFHDFGVYIQTRKHLLKDIFLMCMFKHIIQVLFLQDLLFFESFRYQLFICSFTIRSGSSGLWWIQSGSYLTKKDNQSTLEKRISQGWRSVRKTEIKITQNRNRLSWNENPMVRNQIRKLTITIAIQIK